jgi:hypothetical protein
MCEIKTHKVFGVKTRTKTQAKKGIASALHMWGLAYYCLSLISSCKVKNI